MTPPKETLLNMYRVMVRIRRFEEAVRRLRAGGKIPGHTSLYTGEEAIAAGVCAHLREDDYLTSTHRPLGHLIAKGCDLKRLMAELCAKATGCNRGKGGPYHAADLSVGLIGANGIVGGGPPIAAGAALAAQMRGTDQVSVCFFGEGASNQGMIQETLNLASVWRLPLIFVCENSAVEAPQMLGHMMNYPQVSVEEIAVRGIAYNIPGVTEDGNDVLAVCRAAGGAVRRAREGDGPTLLEFKTSQYGGPFRGEDAARLEEEWRKKDPILRFRARLFEMGILSERDVERIGGEEVASVEEAVRFAMESPEPPLEEALTDVFSDS
ncbi:MAG: thiamine pyrophosphate-dependent dehydrogenase E1 component subunit alpha [Candidatus Bathyarchaeia archaeon]